MSAVVELAPPKVRWDLSALFSGMEDPKIEETWVRSMAAAESFERSYRGQIDCPDLTPELLVSALADLESIYNEVAKPMGFSHLLFATDASDPAVGSFMQKQQEKGTQLNVKLMFFELELQKADEGVVSSVMKDPSLARFRHFVQTTRAFSPYRLGEKEEIVFEETSNTFRPGRTSLMLRSAAARSKPAASAMSIFVIIAKSDVLKIVGYFRGLSSPSVVESRTARRASPRS